MRKKYKLTKRNFGKLANRFKDNFRCYVCGQPFKIGDVVISKSNAKGNRKFYHLSCHENLYIEV